MIEKRNSYDTNDVIALAVKILMGLVAIVAVVYSGIKIFEMIKFIRDCQFCDCCCEDDYYDDDFDCECDCCCDDEDDFAEKVAEVTEKEINPTEE